MNTALRQELARFAEGRVQWDCPLAPYTSFAIGGPAQALVRVESDEELRSLLALLAKDESPWFVLGRGTNLLVADQGFPGVVIVLGQGFAGITVLEEAESVQLQVGASCGLGRLVNFSVEAGFAGLEFCSGIPGSLGGAVVMNAGAFGRELADVLVEVRVVSGSGQERRMGRNALHFRYRSWQDFKESGEPWIVTGATVRCTRDESVQVASRCRQIQEARRSQQPKGYANAGSFFKNPPGDAAGRLIEASGLKGLRRGQAMVSEVHANFLVNCGGATAAEVLALMNEVRERVARDTGILLEPEVQWIG